MNWFYNLIFPQPQSSRQDVWSSIPTTHWPSPHWLPSSSILHVLVQPSPFIVFRSSHSSRSSLTTPFPQPQSLRHVVLFSPHMKSHTISPHPTLGAGVGVLLEDTAARVNELPQLSSIPPIQSLSIPSRHTSNAIHVPSINACNWYTSRSSSIPS